MAQTKQVSKKTEAPKQTKTKKPVLKAMKLKPTEKAVSEEERYRMIAERAYLIAEARGFEGNASMEDWLRAEKEIGKG